MPRIFKGTAIEDSGAVLMARVVDQDNSNITQSSISTITYSVFDMNPANGGATVIASTVLTVSGVVYNALQTGGPWTADETGYNFKHKIPATAFPNGRGPYRVEYKFTPASGEVFYVLYDIPVIEVLS